MNKIEQAISWANKRLKIQGKKLDDVQIEVLTFALQNIASKNLDQPDVSGQLICPNCADGRDEFAPDWKCPECRRNY